MTLYTIGYEGLSTDAFMALLEQHGIEVVVDIRELPLSRKPGFSKKALAQWLDLAGFAYRHVAALGCPKPVRDAYREDGSWQRYTQGFLRHLDGQAEALQDVAALARGSRCALLCFEADANFCHRSLVAQAIHEADGLLVRHIRQTGVKTNQPAGSSALAA